MTLAPYRREAKTPLFEPKTVTTTVCRCHSPPGISQNVLTTYLQGFAKFQKVSLRITTFFFQNQPKFSSFFTKVTKKVNFRFWVGKSAPIDLKVPEMSSTLVFTLMELLCAGFDFFFLIFKKNRKLLFLL